MLTRTPLENAYYAILALNEEDTVKLTDILEKHYKNRYWLRNKKVVKLEAVA